MDVNREKAIDLAVSQIERQFGKGAIMKLGEGGVVKDVLVVSTGSLGLDVALGIGGVPRGRVVEIYGPESSGKTTLALQIVAEAQKVGGMGAYIDAEHALDLGYAQKLGVKTDELLGGEIQDGGAVQGRRRRYSLRHRYFPRRRDCRSRQRDRGRREKRRLVFLWRRAHWPRTRGCETISQGTSGNRQRYYGQSY